jgi:hypothetical protein
MTFILNEGLCVKVIDPAVKLLCFFFFNLSFILRSTIRENTFLAPSALLTPYIDLKPAFLGLNVIYL